ncbi:ribosome-associated toxin RatA of RatAB toxin-antitoxin module [Halospina denitrificans]|uniref:Ribosome-associated toxin RatA of RatAB toxin-antitoxin module n=1 Tax=Halospina denitrificans TaxID=332522 RepID=A0A4R7K0V3_9GAMM|nr:type II toxin-antitoxin system RatA family toxin [Halospina denitrificans]TDT43587.1 ribosome-associated toxin RatA of RatAB toxin-antitoxin module [Halospina denitrificans]
MTQKIERSALVRHSAREMFALVSDVEAYPEFLPWCGNALRHDDGNGQQVTASLEVVRGGLSQRFTTRNHLDPHSCIRMELVDGPFRYLRGYWHFVELREDACKVKLELEFDVDGRVARFAFGNIFHQAANAMVDAFCRRAAELYGARAGSG